MKDIIKGGLLAILILAAFCAVSWIVTCGLIALVALCFGWTFSWAIATGIWILICILRSAFSYSVTVKK